MFKWSCIILESKNCYNPYNAIPIIDSFSLLALTFIGCLSGDKANEFGYAFLNGLFCVFQDLAVSRNDLFHDPSNIGHRKKPILLFVGGVRTSVGTNVVVITIVVGVGKIRRCVHGCAHWVQSCDIQVTWLEALNSISKVYFQRWFEEPSMLDSIYKVVAVSGIALSNVVVEQM
ncbi:hypothetical protein POM88_011261 [Heracleum sosnowskyi]|uniref:Uncharacterized protein n=1 Tax=Heracleum sosnowskyi TaxID=360622 RepID=A0AAD8MWC9_9APIA|nr:hypothetical protein POM88_011261 [Heracleum sosnowskyi]